MENVRKYSQKINFSYWLVDKKRKFKIFVKLIKCDQIITEMNSN